MHSGRLYVEFIAPNQCKFFKCSPHLNGYKFSSFTDWHYFELMYVKRFMEGNIIKLKWWQMALITLAVSYAGRLTAGKSNTANQKVYTTKLKQAPWAPPAWVFGPAWVINNFFNLLALQRIWNMKDSPEKTKLLRMQAGIWLIFLSFNYIYFNKKSTLLAAAWTNADAMLAISSFITALKTDKLLAGFYLPLMTWTSFASTVADYQAIYNKDHFLKSKAIMN